MKSLLSVVMLLLLFLCPAFASESVSGEGGRPAAEDFQHFAALPILAFSEETQWEYGAMLLLFMRPEAGASEGSSWILPPMARNGISFRCRCPRMSFFWVAMCMRT